MKTPLGYSDRSRRIHRGLGQKGTLILTKFCKVLCLTYFTMGMFFFVFEETFWRAFFLFWVLWYIIWENSPCEMKFCISWNWWVDTKLGVNPLLQFCASPCRRSQRDVRPCHPSRKTSPPDASSPPPPNSWGSDKSSKLAGNLHPSSLPARPPLSNAAPSRVANLVRGEFKPRSPSSLATC
jgi:hypothetical protein